MTQDEIIEMARQAGVRDDEQIFEFSQYKYLENFAKLVAAKEREACAKICDNKQYVHPYHDLGTLIRTRGEA
jgi:hypothetical protein